jgi:hypothetical protein
MRFDLSHTLVRDRQDRLLAMAASAPRNRGGPHLLSALRRAVGLRLVRAGLRLAPSHGAAELAAHRATR